MKDDISQLWASRQGAALRPSKPYRPSKVELHCRQLRFLTMQFRREAAERAEIDRRARRLDIQQDREWSSKQRDEGVVLALQTVVAFAMLIGSVSGVVWAYRGLSEVFGADSAPVPCSDQ